MGVECGDMIPIPYFLLGLLAGTDGVGTLGLAMRSRKRTNQNAFLRGQFPPEDVPIRECIR